MSVEAQPGGAGPYVSVVVLHWGAPETTIRCLRSLGKASWPGRCTVLVIDNTGRLDDAAIRNAVPLEMEIHRPGRNLGFSGGCTLGISLAMERGADFVLLLNNDVVVDPMFLDPLVNAAIQRTDAGLLSPQVVLMGTPERAWYRGGKFSLWTGIPVQGHRQIALRTNCSPHDVDYATGCAMLIRPALIRRIGSFDPQLFLYCEDLDLSIRARRAGFRILFVPASVVHHEVTAEPHRRSRAIYYSTRNLIELTRKHAAWYQWFSLGPSFLVRWLGFFAAVALVQRQPRYAMALWRGMADSARGILGESRWADHADAEDCTPIAPP